ncbi:MULTISPECIES: hypothetical protein [Rhodococcus]|uniref:Uncharacterized protein n=1 Tax=Rhodococcus opacus RKJ300 = JCM 13270 TaxID=1165867 RepID=I0WUZ8_RHOOP|nr:MULTISPECIES: hypothetical protein [Rhodococcus]EID80214.1 hypothetical protein W59_08369 [Rhodococcus opacus RKJ300 = JCM 13270]QQZ17714.1 hypothetical protein GO592_17425 [Rhodococcus sp. 21391]
MNTNTTTVEALLGVLKRRTWWTSEPELLPLPPACTGSVNGRPYVRAAADLEQLLHTAHGPEVAVMRRFRATSKCGGGDIGDQTDQRRREVTEKDEASGRAGSAGPPRNTTSNSSNHPTGPVRQGLEAAVENGDPWWASRARAVIDALAATDRVFSADDLRDEPYSLGEPDRPCRWGAAFQVAHREGVITPCGFAVSRRPQRQGGVLRTWRGVRTT